MTQSLGRPEVLRAMEEDYRRRVDEGIQKARQRDPKLWELLDKLKAPAESRS